MHRFQSISFENFSSITSLQKVLFLLLWTSFCFRRNGIFLSIFGLCLSRSTHQYVKGLSTENSQMLFRILNKVSINSCTYYVGETVVNCQSDEYIKSLEFYNTQYVCQLGKLLFLLNVVLNYQSTDFVISLIFNCFLMIEPLLIF